MFDFFKVQKPEEKKQVLKEKEDFNDIDSIVKYIKENIGIDFEDKKNILAIRIKTLCKSHNIYSHKKCLYAFENDNSFREDAINYLTTNESFFYREFSQIQELVQKVSKRNSHVSILCAPCATGEEPYSIVIALLEAEVSKDKFSITGIDISSDAIEKAKQGIYNTNTVRNLSLKIRQRYFLEDVQYFKIDAMIKKQVKFECVNIFENSFERLGKYDYIFSRNMLIYFDNDTKLKAEKIFIQHLKKPGERIFFGHADFPHKRA